MGMWGIRWIIVSVEDLGSGSSSRFGSAFFRMEITCLNFSPGFMLLPFWFLRLIFIFIKYSLESDSWTESRGRPLLVDWWIQAGGGGKAPEKWLNRVVSFGRVVCRGW